MAADSRSPADRLWIETAKAHAHSVIQALDSWDRGDETKKAELESALTRLNETARPLASDAVSPSPLAAGVERFSKELSELKRELKLRDEQAAERARAGDPNEQRYLWLYIVLLVGAVGVTALLFKYGLSDKIEVKVDYNVGEIIGGLMVGVAALIAALTYARRSRG